MGYIKLGTIIYPWSFISSNVWRWLFNNELSAEIEISGFIILAHLHTSKAQHIWFHIKYKIPNSLQITNNLTAALWMNEGKQDQNKYQCQAVLSVVGEARLNPLMYVVTKWNISNSGHSSGNVYFM